jgi:DNA-binding NtrC family response regulator
MGFFSKEKKRILIVDDEPLIIDTTSDYLKDVGYETRGASTAAEALQVMEKEPAGLMLLDINLPDADGLVFLTKFRKQYPEVPVVILTGAGYDESMMQMALRGGASGYLSKETDMDNMGVIVKRLLK